MSTSVGLGLQLPKSPASRPTSSYSGFQLPSSSSSVDSDNDDDDDSALPFPTALARKDFLAPDFDPAAYLSSLFPSDADTTSAHRHQTLEDLRSDLRDRSAAISAELLELVNSNYTSFLGLGDELKGGEDKVEDIRVALLGFRRAVEDIKEQVRRRRTDVSDACAELGEVRAGIERGRRMLELDERVAALEARLAVDSLPKNAADDIFNVDDSDEDDEAEGGFGGPAETERTFVGSSPAKLISLATEYRVIEQLVGSIGVEVPFVNKMGDRIAKCRNTLLLDLNTATKEVKNAGTRGHSRMLRYLAIYRLLEAEEDAIAVFKKK
ncbi:hypothetical protein RB595_009444 [Gaeumannomyces hyphopodioides]